MLILLAADNRPRPWWEEEDGAEAGDEGVQPLSSAKRSGRKQRELQAAPAKNWWDSDGEEADGSGAGAGEYNVP